MNEISLRTLPGNFDRVGDDRKQRVMSRPGYPRDPQGRPLCRYCGELVTASRRRTFCSAECVEEFNIRRSPAVVRRLLFERDHGICALCGIDTKQYETKETGHLHHWEVDHIIAVSEGGGACGLDNYRTLCRACHVGVTAELRRGVPPERHGKTRPAVQLDLGVWKGN